MEVPGQALAPIRQVRHVQMAMQLQFFERPACPNMFKHLVRYDLITFHLPVLLVQQLDYYFSDANWATDKFLKDTAAKNNGYVPIAALSTFKVFFSPSPLLSLFLIFFLTEAGSTIPQRSWNPTRMSLFPNQCCSC